MATIVSITLKVTVAPEIVANAVCATFEGAFVNQAAINGSEYVKNAWSVQGAYKRDRIDIDLYNTGKLVIKKADEAKVEELRKIVCA